MEIISNTKVDILSQSCNAFKKGLEEDNYKGKLSSYYIHAYSDIEVKKVQYYFRDCEIQQTVVKHQLTFMAHISTL